MYHVELRQFPHSARAFNLGRAELEPLLEGWRGGHPVRWGERDWEPRRARLTVLEGPELATSELGMGRGWPEAQRRGREVTDVLLRAGDGELRAALLEHCGEAPVSLAELARATGHPRAALERAVWALVVSGELDLVRRPPD